MFLRVLWHFCEKLKHLNYVKSIFFLKFIEIFEKNHKWFTDEINIIYLKNLIFLKWKIYFIFNNLYFDALEKMHWIIHIEI